MANEVVYADLNLPEAGQSRLPQACYLHQCPRWHHVALRVGGSGYIVLLVAVVALSVSENATYPSREKQCLLCPKDWLFHGDKCYRLFEKIQKDWNKSYKNCSEKHAQMLVIQNQEEKAFIKKIVKNKNAFWIGLQFNSWNQKWLWVDGSPLRESMWPELSPAEDQLDPCGTFKENKIASESCNSDLSWACQMKAFVI